ncbi:methylated-DNA--[protein]-cysteine S-methyltransferase [Clostridium formicaceticum]|nr:methylated-DNA--[protein]-cysteine S-methyltransferase [Clostridium formicaceticum]ARE86732.1 Methylated-DNA--protein-cysteine methyltransferase, constitutive [Clostridium formicaceticum]
MDNLYYCNRKILDYSLYIASSEKGVLAIAFEELEEDFLKSLKKDFSSFSIIYDEDANQLPLQQLEEYFQGEREVFTVSLDLVGTNFQKQVWRELLRIPYGKVVTYQDIAIKIGNPKAVRAVGMANKKNKIAIMVPCHRVIGSNKKLVGYDGGLDIKEKLLTLEGFQVIEEKVIRK